MTEKIYYIYKFSGNPDPVGTCDKLKRNFGDGYVFDDVHPNASEKYSRDEIRELFHNDMRKGCFTKVIVDTSFGFGRFMKEEMALAEELGISVEKVDLRKIN